MSRMILLALVVVGCGNSEPVEPEHPSADPPPSWGVPLTGGTMLVTRDGRRAVISDPDRDRIATVDLASGQVVADIALTAGDEPGRLVEDGAGRIHVALRRGGALVTVPDPASGQGLVRRPVCSEPRGVAYDPVTDQLHVACTGGELVSFAASGGDATRRLQLDRDLRDVVVSGTDLIVTRFRTAEVLTIDAHGAVVDRAAPPIVKRPGTSVGFDGPSPPLPQPPLVDAVPAVAWRTIALPDGRMLMTHQRQIKSPLGMMQGGYGGGCGTGLVESAITVVQPGSAPVAVAPFVNGALPIDIAVTRSMDAIAAISAGSKLVTIAYPTALSALDTDGCSRGDSPIAFSDELGTPSSVAFASSGALLVYYPEVPALVVRSSVAPGATATTIMLPGELGYDSGRALFHTQTNLGIACASCHPEGRDDGLVWDFAEIGLRRTQSLAGHILRRAPYHWGADMADLDQLMDDVFSNRMAGGLISRSARRSLGPWLDRIPAPVATPIDPAASARGKQLFESAELACTTCHAGELLTNNQRFDVSTGGTFKVPSLLGVGARAPYLHDGCAATLADRFGPCGGGDLHGHTSALTAPQLADLIAYLEAI